VAAPVVISSYQTSWRERFDELKALLCGALGAHIVEVEHVGSTAVPGLDAKPIIDLDIVISEVTDFEQIRLLLCDLGYRHLGDQGIPSREAFEPGEADGAGVADHHLYVCRESSSELRRHLAFRDYLRNNPEGATEYGQLKRRLADKFRDDRESYTEAKGRFIEQALDEASHAV
jgi:GrpB-like predicted nucleotidyltransferase (UPF0157 family)